MMFLAGLFVGIAFGCVFAHRLLASSIDAAVIKQRVVMRPGEVVHFFDETRLVPTLSLVVEQIDFGRDRPTTMNLVDFSAYIARNTYTL